MKYLFCLFLSVILVNCDISVQKTKAQINNNEEDFNYYIIRNNIDPGTEVKKIEIDSIQFLLFQSDGSNSRGIPFVINLTKEKLEIELLKKQLKK